MTDATPEMLSAEECAALDAVGAAGGTWSERLRTLEPVLADALPQRAVDSAALYFTRQTRHLTVDQSQLSAFPKISARIRMLILTWLGSIRDDEVTAHAAFATIVRDPVVPPRVIWQTADRIWSLALPGSPDHGFPFYSKRTILSGVLGSALLYQFSGRTPEEVARFVDRRLANVALIGRLRRMGRSR
ncbi:ubiquinone biosynthesis protein COQ9 [Tanticharoenia sakaeratensis]|uniref:COQ9 C-terminal domain-containing protein n=1 Tax=Tanticharoenia sakaeratensis NBRC 103193 TaxID=1231623 RepID=A0A0D6MN33_9PROT|nr:hypothetical protein [Tanticharoenia sakaeratensis]GAN55094.1 hypothetical protein Tasa_038_075 [Tanticharoenia sakaeratensis NBRC 103193]GBQ20199.1 hypothetical protein AA103193_1299 [Tanticharoenia sakaeratensis NBRC 103193]